MRPKILLMNFYKPVVLTNLFNRSGINDDIYVLKMYSPIFRPFTGKAAGKKTKKNEKHASPDYLY